ncbi:MAG TPA: hypothetical protein VJY64_01455 [Candidatus Onthovivens sp.]|nr:hypothetical protein [Candidatus Onthovivens sp.]
MTMQDKLVKTHQKKHTYYLKKMGVFCGCFIGACILVAIPVSIFSKAQNENMIAKEDKVPEIAKSELLTY